MQSSHLVLSHDHSQDRSPVLPSFCGGGKVWAEDPCQFEDVINCDIGEVTLASISHALLQVGWLGACREYIAIPKRSIGLGDIGYMDHDGLFIFVTNLHTLLQPDGCVPIWTVKQWLEGWWQDSEDKVRGSLTYKRARQVWISCTIRYTLNSWQSPTSQISEANLHNGAYDYP